MNLTLKSILGYQSINDIVVYQKAVYDKNRPISLQQIVSDLIYLDHKVPSHTHLLNLYENRYHFLLVLLLGIKRNSIHLFPSNTTDHTLSFLEKQYPSLLVLNNIKPQLETANFLDIESLLNNKNKHCDLGKNKFRSIYEHYMDEKCTDTNRVIIFTSGSTGNPKPFSKKWSDFIAVAKQLGRELGIENLSSNNNSMFLATVPAQHMYGLEVSIMTPLIMGIAIYEERPFYPADIEKILIEQQQLTFLITTPIHLRACSKTEIKLPHLECVISATAPLDRKLAKSFEVFQKTQVIEIYGCTEVGVTALRQASKSEQWRCLGDIRLKQVDNTPKKKSKKPNPFDTEYLDYSIETSRSINTFVLNDYISDVIEENNTIYFLLKGRKEDIINIAGKRTSLSYLNYHLLNCDGIKDACFYQPEGEEDKQQRLILFVVLEKPQLFALSMEDKNRFTKNLKTCLDNKVDIVFSPRKIYFISHLPRNKTGKIMFNELELLYHDCKR